MAELFEAEESETQAASFETDSAAVSVALGRARGRKRGAADAGDAAEQRFLAAQEALIADQRRHLAAQYRTLGLDDWHKRLRLLTQVMTVLAGLLVLGVALWTAWDAHNADGIVIKPFSMPPPLVQRGVTGEAVASKIMDRLDTMAEVARPTERQKSVDADWGHNISIAIPETGLSLSQVDQWLREKLGRQRQITGEVSLNPDGTLTVDARIGGHPLPSQTGPEADLAKMESKLAEAIYTREQPISMYEYFANQGQWQAALELDRAGIATAKTPEERALLVNGVGVAIQNLQGDLAAKPYLERALAMTPNVNAFVPNNLGGIEFDLGHTERALALQRLAMVRLRVSEIDTPEARRKGELITQKNIAGVLGDFGEALRDATAANPADMVAPGGETISDLVFAQTRAKLHETSAAISSVQAFEPHGQELARVKESLLTQAYFAADDWANVASHADQWSALAAAMPDRGAVVARSINSVKAKALASLGRIAEAQRLVDPLPLDCDFCLVARGQVAAAAGDARTADHWFGEAVRLTPSLPLAIEAWGRTLLERGDAKGALAKFDAARAKGPRFADAIEGRGEALLMLGDAKAADTAFAEAAKLTPKWGRLRLKWGEALAKLGKAEEARSQFKAAAGLDLSADEKAELAKVRT